MEEEIKILVFEAMSEVFNEAYKTHNLTADTDSRDLVEYLNKAAQNCLSNAKFNRTPKQSGIDAAIGTIGEADEKRKVG